VPLYSDVNPVGSGTTPVLTDGEAVNQALQNLLNTAKGERLFRGDLGLDLSFALFAPINDLTSAKIESMFLTALPGIDPRIKIQTKYFRVTPVPDEQRYDIRLVYAVAGLTGEEYEFNGQLDVAA
jgi:phage baseplate assembly protein W